MTRWFSSAACIVMLSLLLAACKQEDDQCPGGNWRADPTTGECPQRDRGTPTPTPPNKPSRPEPSSGGPTEPAETRLAFPASTLPAPLHAPGMGVVTFPPLPAGFRVRESHWHIEYQVNFFGPGGGPGTPGDLAFAALGGGRSEVLFRTDAAGAPVGGSTGDLRAPGYGDVTLTLVATLDPGEGVVITVIAASVEVWGH